MHILNKTPIMEAAPLKYTPFIILVLFIVILIVCIVYARTYEISEGFCLLLHLMVVWLLVSTIIYMLESNIRVNESGKYKYEVTIDDTVSANELLDKYNIVEQRGDIWIIEDKEKTNETD